VLYIYRQFNQEEAAAFRIPDAHAPPALEPHNPPIQRAFVVVAVSQAAQLHMPEMSAPAPARALDHYRHLLCACKRYRTVLVPPWHLIT
jgi:hypothetical protein